MNFAVSVLIEYGKCMLFLIAGNNYLPEIFICIFILSCFELYFSILYLLHIYIIYVLYFIVYFIIQIMYIYCNN